MPYSVAMPINRSLLGELTQELATTRKLLSRLPDDRFDWKPHGKSMTLGQLASHLTEIHTWLPVTLATTELDLAPVDGPKREGFQATTTAQVLVKFDEAAAELLRSLEQAPDDAPWL
ncbi:MAG: DinB family protein [Acidobacteria bacterium]|nr:DinB family protein [Acidobacteriota bacterium]